MYLFSLQKSNGIAIDKNIHQYEVIQFETPELDVCLVKLMSLKFWIWTKISINTQTERERSFL